jgi:hypothetical protein
LLLKNYYKVAGQKAIIISTWSQKICFVQFQIRLKVQFIYYSRKQYIFTVEETVEMTYNQKSIITRIFKDNCKIYKKFGMLLKKTQKS